MSTPTKPTVFISYSHKDESWKDRFVPQLRALEQAGRIVVWDDRKIDGGDKWYPEIKTAMEQAAIAVCLISSDFLASDFCIKEEVPFLLQRCERDGMIFIPVLLRPCAWTAFEWLKEIQMLPRDGKSVLVDFRWIEDAVFAEVANLVLRFVDDPSEYELPESPVPLWSVPEKIDIDRLPETGDELFGRQKELQLLDEAWESRETNIVSLVAWGGVGKSTLVNKWLERMQADNYRGARCVYAWSFYSQGTGERVTSADQFISHALTWFGDPDPTAGSPWDKGERLAKLVQSAKALLVLDGLEPLQCSQTFEKGRMREPALVTLLTELARLNEGLCLITTREQVIDLTDFTEKVVQKDLEQISDEAGRALLRVSGVQGTDAELEQATRDFGNHALAVNLLAVYLRDITDPHVSHASAIPDLEISEKQGKHPRRVIAALSNRFGEGPEVELLKMLGLFDRPADTASLRALRKAPTIQGLSDHTRKLSDPGWLRNIEKLRQFRLISPKSGHRPNDVDAHPLVRQHFGEQLKQHFPEVWRGGNYRLYEHLRHNSKVFPSNLEEMASLYSAVIHGCEAGQYMSCLADVYRKRILRGDKCFSIYTLGSYSMDLAVLSRFFSVPWDRLVDGIDDESSGFLLNSVGYYLQQVGRLTDAALPLEVAMNSAISRKDWTHGATAAANLTFLYLTKGDLNSAVTVAKMGVETADHGLNWSRQLDNRTWLAHALHQVGRISEAEEMFREAEDQLGRAMPQYPKLHSIPGFRFCVLLLDQGKYSEVFMRARQSIEWVAPSKWRQAIALDNLLLGQASFLETLESGSGDFQLVILYLGLALDGLRNAQSMAFLPLALTARSRLNRTLGGFQSARVDLDEAMKIAMRGHMGVYQADCHLEYARLLLAQGEDRKAAQYWNSAREMIERMGYHRRDKDVKEIEGQLAKI